MVDKVLQRAVAATKAFFAAQAEMGTASDAAEGWRDACDDLYHQLDADGQKAIRKLERRLKKHHAKGKDVPE